MKRVYAFAALLLCCFFPACLGGCGEEEERQYFELQIENKAFYDVAGANEGMFTSFLGMQFYQDEPAQIWAVYDGVSNMDAYLYRMDGTRELLLENVGNEYARGGGFLDGDGNFYYWAVNQGSIIKVDSSGERIYNRQLSELGVFEIERMFQLGDARCVENNDGALADRLCQVDPHTGDMVKINSDIFVRNPDICITAGEDCLLCMTPEGVWKADAEEGTWEDAWSFLGTTYVGPLYDRSTLVWDFRIREDGSLEVLEAGNDMLAKGDNGVAKTMRKLPLGADREVVVLRGANLAKDTWIKGCVRRFNEQSEEWYIVMEDCGGGYERWENYTRQTSVEIGAGKGPDILYGDILGDHAYSVLQKGGFADLAPYLEASGLKKEDFFPCTFGRWQSGERIYSVSPNIGYWRIRRGGILMDASLFGGNETPGVEEIVEVLLAQKGDAVFLRQIGSQEVLEWFLAGTDDLWGMVDWEKGTCGFRTELFVGMLEAAKRYDGEWRENDARPSLAEMDDYSIYEYQTDAFVEERGKLRIGYLFDDGYHMNARDDCTLAVNANSRHKDGAWEFIRYLLEEGQMSQPNTDIYPANKKYYDIRMKSEMAKGLWKDGEEFYDPSNDKIQYYSPITEERIAEIKEILENARFEPIRTRPILDIIYEEAQGYFNGTKDIDETIEVINNRVQVFLDEGLHVFCV